MPFKVLTKQIGQFYMWKQIKGYCQLDVELRMNGRMHQYVVTMHQLVCIQPHAYCNPARSEIKERSMCRSAMLHSSMETGDLLPLTLN